MEKDVKSFGDIYLDTDSDPKINKGSDYILNTIIQSDGRFGMAVNIKGNESFTDSGLLGSISGDNICKIVGSCKDELRSRIIYFLSMYDPPDSLNYGAILWIDVNTGDNQLILDPGSDILNIHRDSVIKASILGDMLIWADGDFLKEINYIRAFNYTNSISSPYTYSLVNDSTIRFYKKPYDGTFTLTPIDPGSTLYPDASFKSLATKSFQFAIKYVYNDYQKSVLCQYSDLIWMDEFSLSNGKGEVVSYSSVNINFTVPTNKDILRVELYVRENETTNWYLYDTITILGSISYPFDNTRVWEAVDQEDISRPYDFIPKKVGTLEVIEKDKLIVGDIVEDYDPVVVDASVSLYSTTAHWSTPVENNSLYHRDDGTYHYFTLTSFSLQDPVSLTTFNTGFVVLRMPVRLFQRGSIPNAIFPSILYTTVTSLQNITYSLDDIILVCNVNSSSSISSVMTYFYNQLKLILKDSLYGTWHLDLGNYDSHTNCIRMNKIASLLYPTDYNSNDSALFLDINMTTYYPTWPIKTVKNSDSYLASIVYFDRDMRFQTVDKLLSPANVTPNIPLYHNLFQITIRNRPPVWAYYYCIAFTKRTQTDFYLQLIIESQKDYFFGDDGYLKIRLNALINKIHDLNNKVLISGYQWEQGDRLRLLMLDKELTYSIISQDFPQNDVSYAKDASTGRSYILDANGNKIFDTSSSFITVSLKNTDILDPIINPSLQASSYTTLQIEVYRPKKTTDKPFYFHDTIHAVGNPGTITAYHTGDVNQSSSNPSGVPAIVKSTWGDCYYRQRFAKKVFNCIDDNFSDYYQSNYYGLKTPNIFNQDAAEKSYPSGMRYGGPFLEDTKVNKINVFKESDLEIFKSKFGSINSINEVGNVLKVLQDRKESSTYIGRTELENADNTENVVKSTALLGTTNKALEDRGTIFPKAVVVHNRNMYYPDIYTGEIIRSSANGQIPISEYGMRTYFKNKFKSILAVGTSNVDIIGAFDEENKMYLITFIMPSGSETLGFYDPPGESGKPRWVSFFSFISEHYASLGNFLLSFKSGVGYKHNSTNVPRCQFYGAKYKQQINWYSNANSIFKKVFKVLGIKSNVAWDVPVLLIEADSTYIRGMQSLLKTNHFELKEGEYSAAYLNNMLSTSNTPSVGDLFNGDELRGYALKHQIDNMQDEEVWLLDASTSYDLSNQY